MGAPGNLSKNESRSVSLDLSPHLYDSSGAEDGSQSRCDNARIMRPTPLKNVPRVVGLLLVTCVCMTGFTGGSRTYAFNLRAPQPGAVFKAGQEILVAVESEADVGLRETRYYWYRENEELLEGYKEAPALVATVVSDPPFGGRIRVPSEALGRMRLLVIGEVLRGRLGGYEDFDEVVVTIDSPAALRGIEFAAQKPWQLDTIGKLVEVPAVGQFADGVLRHLAGTPTGTSYRSSNERIVRIDPEGMLRVVGNGRATVAVFAQGKEGTLDVVVDAEEEANGIPVARVPSQITVKSGMRVVLDGLQSSDPDGDPLRYQWRQVRGLKVALLNRDEAKATFMAPKVASRRLLRFTLQVTDMKGPDSVKGADSAPAAIDVWVEP